MILALTRGRPLTLPGSLEYLGHLFVERRVACTRELHTYMMAEACKEVADKSREARSLPRSGALHRRGHRPAGLERAEGPQCPGFSGVKGNFWLDDLIGAAIGVPGAYELCELGSRTTQEGDLRAVETFLVFLWQNLASHGSVM